ncbi:MAG: urea carboxylase [Verrucomicrobia bacterium]|nr:MAG: urea carboxylase [Verrucomicrobiota bacterium]
MSKPLFQKILIANRGEIAVRVAKTFRRLGIQTIAVYSDADREAPHVLAADEAYHLGPGPVSQSYLNLDRLLEVIALSGAQAVHPGYGLLSENAEFAEKCEAIGCVWLGPTGDAMRRFGLKHTAREIAQAANVPLCPGTGLLDSLDQARIAAQEIGFPLMLKSTAGGGGIGMQVCRSENELLDCFEKVIRLAASNFKDSGVFLERYVETARHIEVQVFGDGKGRVLALGERDCSAQRRNQKVVEETPAPGISQATREALFAAAVRLCEAIGYRSAGTVEFLYDVTREQFYFLEVNTRLQVEHGITELATGIDIVEWMVRLGAGENPLDGIHSVAAKGAAIEVRIYAEDASKQFMPSAGRITAVELPSDARCDGWVVAGTEVSTFYDPLLVKIQVLGETRDEAIRKLLDALSKTRIGGIRTNLDYLSALIESEAFQRGGVTTSWLDSFIYQPRTLDILKGGTMTTVQDWPGRQGYWDVGVPPSGPMDGLAHRVANRLVGNPEGTAALECTMVGPTIRFSFSTVIAVVGAEMNARLDGEPVPLCKQVNVRAGQVLEMGKSIHGCRTILAVAGGIAVPDYMGSKSTFTLGQFGGHGGRSLAAGDVLEIGENFSNGNNVDYLFPEMHGEWRIGVLYGPHGAPDFFTEQDVETFFATAWEVHFNSARTGVRLVGPKPQWARADGGEAGLHPSNIHDNAYAIGAVDFTGDMPVILGPDGPSLGGFVCPVTIINAELWKMGQLKPGDRVHFVPVSLDVARGHAQAVENWLDVGGVFPEIAESRRESMIVGTSKIEDQAVVIRRAGDSNLLIEIGDLLLDLRLRFMVHLLYESLRAQNKCGVIDLTPGIRSLQVHYHSNSLCEADIIFWIKQSLLSLPHVDEAEVDSRVVHLPLSWDDPSTQVAIDRYTSGVRADAPWCPSNIEFIRRINGLESIGQVKEIVYSAEYLVMGLGDVYLGAPVATPLDPRHRLVTTKYNPARTWTPENAVGIGGAYLCIYGMEGPGGYQFVGRTVPIWNKFRNTAAFEKKWLLRFFDRIHWYEVSADDLLDLRRDILTGKYVPEIREERFNLGEYLKFLEQEDDSIEAFRITQRQAFAAERKRWEEAGLQMSGAEEVAAAPEAIVIPDGCELLESPMMGSVWKIEVSEGQQVAEAATAVVLEAMKMEMAVPMMHASEVVKVLVSQGSMIRAGDPLLIVRRL